jgi:hypothetical protein
MLNNLLKKVFGSRNDRLIKQYFQAVGRSTRWRPGLLRSPMLSYAQRPMSFGNALPMEQLSMPCCRRHLP